MPPKPGQLDRSRAAVKKAGRLPRHLTEGEIALAQTRFGNRIDYKKVRICDGPGLNPIAWYTFNKEQPNPAITLNKTVYIGEGYADDLSLAGNEGEKLLLHEMTHVLQYREMGVLPFFRRYLKEYRQSGNDADATYSYQAGKTRYQDATLEAQAQMVEDFSDASLDPATRELVRQSLKGSGLRGIGEPDELPK